MAQIEIEVGGRIYPLTCRDDEEAQLRRAASLLDRRCREASAAMGMLSEPRQLLLGALLIADELLDGGGAAVTTAPEDQKTAARIGALAQQIEKLCSVLEIKPPSA